MKLTLTRYEAGIGGSCLLQDLPAKNRPVLVCNDTGMGPFKLLKLTKMVTTRQAVAQFTAEYCTGG